MGKIVLVTGGARSGKSSFAESKLLQGLLHSNWSRDERGSRMAGAG